ncbi:MAG TPA: hypothetical protein VFS00_32045 [Polyangiaceae bacterium]|nr:hypothetical protein [Polyangiaceae bacterium]
MQKKHEAMRAVMHERLASFAGDAFDAEAFVSPPTDAKAGAPGNHFEPMLDALAVAVPVLDATQREALAARLEQGPAAFAGRPDGRPHHVGR